MAGNAIQNLVSNRDTIRRLMAMDSNGQLNNIYKEAKASGSVIEDENGITYSPKKKAVTNVINEEVLSKSKLPKSVLESFKKDPGSPFMSGPNEMQMGSVLDGLDLESLETMRNEKEQLVENKKEQSSNGPIDYSLIKTIINEAVQENVKKYISAMTKKLMTESVNGGGNNVKAVKIGDKFSFITEDGDVYEATLKYKTNLNEQKKK